MKHVLKRVAWIRALYQCLQPLLPRHPVDGCRNYLRFWQTFREYKKAQGSSPCRLEDISAQTHDWHSSTPISYYFYQDTWAFRKIVDKRPEQHVDVGSTALLVGCLAAIVPTVSIDVRPLEARIPGLQSRRGLITDLPFADDSVLSLSSLCVIEHIGLGRYGDPIDPDGSRKAARELSRVLAKGGDLYVSAPLGRSYIAFNAHRSFVKDEFIAMFPELKLMEFQLVNDHGSTQTMDPNPCAGLHVGLFHFSK